MCGLVEVADAIIGTLSIEDRKRTSIAIELAAQPEHLLFLDEPTSDLDSRAALAVIALLRDLANLGQAIFVTLQRPSYEVLRHFDQVLVLGKDGKTVYSGKIGLGFDAMISYFESNGARQCEADANPYDHFPSYSELSADPLIHGYLQQRRMDDKRHPCRGQCVHSNQLAGPVATVR